MSCCRVHGSAGPPAAAAAASSPGSAPAAAAAPGPGADAQAAGAEREEAAGALLREPAYNWQASKPTVQERFAFLFNNEVRAGRGQRRL